MRKNCSHFSEVFSNHPRSYGDTVDWYGVATISTLRKIIGLFCTGPYKRDDILQKRPKILRSLLIVATPYVFWKSASSERRRKKKKEKIITRLAFEKCDQFTKCRMAIQMTFFFCWLYIQTYVYMYVYIQIKIWKKIYIYTCLYLNTYIHIYV